MKLSDQIIAHPWISKRVAEYYRWYPNDLNKFSQNQLTSLTSQNLKGLYIHIPFCSEICKFCPFNKRKSDASNLEEYVVSVCSEIDLYSKIGVYGNLSFIYFGGGTPSILSPKQLEQILNTIRNCFEFQTDIEISIEAHPKHITNEYAIELKKVGVNRISSGVQSFNDTILKNIGATHTAKYSYSASEIMRNHFDNSGIDLLYKCNGQEIFHWENDLMAFNKFEFNHLSTYVLTLPKNQSNSGIEEINMATYADSYLTSQNYQHYASCATGGFDFSREGYKCKYETEHWGSPQSEYLGIGAGAFGFVANRTTVNLHNIEKYIISLSKGKLPLLSLSSSDSTELLHRNFVLGVKTLNIDLKPLLKINDNLTLLDFLNRIDFLKSNGMVVVVDDNLQVTDIGRYFIDQLSEVFWSGRQIQFPHLETTNLVAFERTN